MKTPDTASALQHMARRAQDILVRSAAEGARTDERHAAWQEALDHLSDGGEPVTAEQADVAEFLELLAASSVTDPVVDDGDQDGPAGESPCEARSPLSPTVGYWSRLLAAAAAFPGSSSGHAVEYIDNSVSAVLSRLAEPTRPLAQRSRGLVVGYVQSGKTTNFTAVAAKAIDAGYRLVIVVSGPRNSQRLQVQRALDALLVDGEEDPILRITNAEHDYQGTEADRQLWAFRRSDPALPLNTVSNLRHTAPRLLAVKRDAGVLGRLVRDLTAHGAGLSEVPALVIDDEPDPWSAAHASPPGRGRPGINEIIAQLLELLPRSQYVNYAWMPFVRSALDPAGEGALLPADYVVRLPRPDSYLGSDEVSSGDAQVVRVWRTAGLSEDDDGSLRHALDMFVLTGAVKLFRQAASRDYRFPYHSMLVLEADREVQRQLLSGRLLRLWQEADYDSADSAQRLSRLFDDELRKPSGSYAEGACLPTTFEELRPYIRGAAERIASSPKPVKEMRDTHQDRWRILVDSPVSTGDLEVEGLTVTHLRQPANSRSDVRSLAQWFGRHHGYRDLVRVYVQLGTGQGRTWNQVREHFESLCRAEVASRPQSQVFALAPGTDMVWAEPLFAPARHVSWQHGGARTENKTSPTLRRATPDSPQAVDPLLSDERRTGASG
ncbi:Z1 domain-containing protein [Streptomyces olivaceus]|uniref:Z1 domain-containing protein n=1 Tax=Streptomyces olivaceus TaxID=47716 RepID=UPI0004C5F262|nr:Z1 domain-containing protein [Streptomyces olivaceus]MBZ6107948.1 Z1 domain-containing protein [Streptomyces olivaceus]